MGKNIDQLTIVGHDSYFRAGHKIKVTFLDGSTIMLATIEKGGIRMGYLYCVQHDDGRFHEFDVRWFPQLENIFVGVSRALSQTLIALAKRIGESFPSKSSFLQETPVREAAYFAAVEAADELRRKQWAENCSAPNALWPIYED